MILKNLNIQDEELNNLIADTIEGLAFSLVDSDSEKLLDENILVLKSKYYNKVNEPIISSVINKILFTYNIYKFIKFSLNNTAKRLE